MENQFKEKQPMIHSKINFSQRMILRKEQKSLQVKTLQLISKAKNKKEKKLNDSNNT